MVCTGHKAARGKVVGLEEGSQSHGECGAAEGDCWCGGQAGTKLYRLTLRHLAFIPRTMGSYQRVFSRKVTSICTSGNYGL